MCAALSIGVRVALMRQQPRDAASDWRWLSRRSGLPGKALRSLVAGDAMRFAPPYAHGVNVACRQVDKEIFASVSAHGAGLGGVL